MAGALDPLAPVRAIPGDSGEEPAEGVGLCLSGGGYRAMIFHIGVMRRLDDAGLLGRLDRISSVSGGSIAAGVLALAWPHLELNRKGLSSGFQSNVEAPLRGLAAQTIDVWAVVTGIFTRDSIGERVAEAYRDHAFGKATLQDLPDRPRFVINATNMGSGALARFSRAEIADYRVGRIDSPDVELAVAVACSSAFPPVLSPYRLDTGSVEWVTEDGNDLATADQRDELVLSDGGVYDNLGLETVWKKCRTVIVSDAGGQIEPDPDADSDWPRHMLRVLKTVDNQVRALRKQQVISGMERGDRDGVYLGIRSDIRSYGLEDSLPAPLDQTLALARVPTRLEAMDDRTQERLINWGYAICDAAVRKHMEPALGRPPGLPYPDAGMG